MVKELKKGVDMANQGPQSLQQQLNALREEIDRLQFTRRTGPGRDLLLNALKGQISELPTDADVGLTMSKAMDTIFNMIYVATQLRDNLPEEVARPGGLFEFYRGDPPSIEMGIDQATWIGEMLLSSQFNTEIDGGRYSLQIPDDPVTIARMDEFRKYLNVSSFIEKNIFAAWIEKAFNEFKEAPADKKAKFRKKDIGDLAAAIGDIYRNHGLTLKQQAQAVVQQFASVSDNPKSLSAFHRFCAHQAARGQELIEGLAPALTPSNRPGRGG